MASHRSVGKVRKEALPAARRVEHPGAQTARSEETEPDAPNDPMKVARGFVLAVPLSAMLWLLIAWLL